MTHNSSHVGDHLIIISVPRVSLFVKVTKGAKDFLKYPEIALTTETPHKHPREHKIRVLGWQWQESHRQPPRLSGVQHRSSAQLQKDVPGSVGEKS